MTKQLISRRAMAPALAVGIVAATPIAVAAAPASSLARGRGGKKPREVALGSITRLFRGNRQVIQFFLPEGPLPVGTPSEFRFTLRTLDGTVFVDQQFQLLPGRGTEMTLNVQGDGTVIFNGEMVVGDFDGDGNGDSIIGILIGLLLPAVQMPVGTVTTFIPGRAGEPPREVREAGYWLVAADSF